MSKEADELDELEKRGFELVDFRDDPGKPIPEGYKTIAIEVSDCLDQGRTANLFKATGLCIKKGLRGDFAEFGVFRGQTCLAFCKFLQHLGVTGGKLHMFDTFTGLPDPSPQDLDEQTLDNWVHYDQYSSSERAVRALMHGYEEYYVIHKGIFMDYLDFNIPLVLAHIDPDLYQGVKDAVEICENVMVDGGIIVIDDYETEWSGVTAACDEMDMTKWSLIGKGAGQWVAIRTK